MIHQRTTDETQETAALYALGALSQFESRAFEAHIREGCLVCRDELAQFDNVVGAMGAAVPAVEAPAFLRDVLMARIEKESKAQAAAPLLRQQRVVNEEKKRGSSLGLVILPWAIAASLLICFVYTLNALRTEQRESQARLDEMRSAQQELMLAKQQLLETSQQVHQLAEINLVLGTSERRLIALAGQEPAPSASGNIYWDVPNRKWVVSATLPPAPEGKVYELWFVTADKKVPAGLIKPDEKGRGFAVIDVPADLGELAAAAITLEPEGGSQQPTMPIYAMGTPR